MPKGKKLKVVPVSLEITGTVVVPATITTEFKPPQVPQTANSNYTKERRVRSSFVSSVVQPSGWRPPTPYRSAAARRVSLPFYLVNVNPGSSVTRISGGSVPTTGSTYGYAPADTLFFSSLGIPTVSTNTVIRAEVEALNKLRDSRIDLGASLAESRETVRYIADSALWFWRFIDNFRKGRWGNCHQMLFGRRGPTPKDAADAWLAYKFGLLPLMSDLHGTFEAFRKGILEKDALIHVSRQVKSNVTPLFVPTGNWTEARQYGEVWELAKVVFYAKISDATLQALSSWGVTNPLAAVWEGLGWSFLVDWILPVGNFLKALDATVGLTFLSGTKTTRMHADLTYLIRPNVSGTTLIGNPIMTKYKCLATQRTVYTTWPTPWTYVKNPLSSSHTSIVAALILSLGSD